VGEQLVTVTGEQGVTVILHHHCIRYGRWRPNFGGSGHAFECNGFLLFLMMFSLHHYGQIIIYHHCIWYGRWRANFGGSGHAFECNGFLLFFMMFSLHHYGQIIIYHHFIWYERWRPNFGCSGHAFGGWLVHWMVYFVHLVNRVIWSSGHMYLW